MGQSGVRPIFLSRMKQRIPHARVISPPMTRMLPSTSSPRKSSPWLPKDAPTSARPVNCHRRLRRMPERAAVGMVPFFSARTMRRLTKKMTTQPRSSTLRNRSPTPFHAEGLRGNSMLMRRVMFWSVFSHRSVIPSQATGSKKRLGTEK